MPQQGFKKKELTWQQRKQLYHQLEMVLAGGVLPRGSFTRLQRDFGVGALTLSRTWRQLRAERVGPFLDAQPNNGVFPNGDRAVVLPDHLFFTNKGDNGMNRLVYDREELQRAIKLVPFNKRQTYKAAAHELGIPVTTMRRLTKEGVFRNHTSAVKPTLKEHHKMARLLYALDHIDPATINSRHGMKFKEELDVVYVDEKWFYKTKESRRYILAPDEEPPKRTTSHKGYVDKVMFLCAQARPRRLANGTWWDGKIAMLPIGEITTAERTSEYRAAGADVWKSCSVTMDVYRRMMLEVCVLILEKWPNSDWNKRVKIRIQQDNAPSHMSNEDPGWMNGLIALGLDDKIDLFTQSAQSPDTNILDLGLFRAIEALYNREVPKTYLDIIECVQRAYREYPANKINRIWLSHQGNMNLIIETLGCNQFDPPHMGKDKLEREGRLPRVVGVTEDARRHLVVD